MADINKQDVEHVANLARLELTEDEKSRFTQEIGEILNYANELSKASTENITPISQISGLSNMARKDEIKNPLGEGQLLENAPSRENGYIKVKKVFE